MDASKRMDLMSLGVKCGDKIVVRVEGEDEKTAVGRLFAAKAHMLIVRA